MDIKDMELLLESYETIPRESKSMESRELQAIRDIRQLLCFMEKKILGHLNSEDEIKAIENSKCWVEGIEILRKYIEK